MNPPGPDDPATARASASDELFVFDDTAQRLVAEQKPWTRDPHYFKKYVDERVDEMR